MKGTKGSLSSHAASQAENGSGAKWKRGRLSQAFLTGGSRLRIRRRSLQPPPGIGLPAAIGPTHLKLGPGGPLQGLSSGAIGSRDRGASGRLQHPSSSARRRQPSRFPGPWAGSPLPPGGSAGSAGCQSHAGGATGGRAALLPRGAAGALSERPSLGLAGSAAAAPDGRAGPPRPPSHLPPCPPGPEPAGGGPAFLGPALACPGRDPLPRPARGAHRGRRPTPARPAAAAASGAQWRPGCSGQEPLPPGRQGGRRCRFDSRARDPPEPPRRTPRSPAPESPGRLERPLPPRAPIPRPHLALGGGSGGGGGERGAPGRRAGGRSAESGGGPGGAPPQAPPPPGPYARAPVGGGAPGVLLARPLGAGRRRRRLEGGREGGRARVAAFLSGRRRGSPRWSLPVAAPPCCARRRRCQSDCPAGEKSGVRLPLEEPNWTGRSPLWAPGGRRREGGRPSRPRVAPSGALPAVALLGAA